MLKKIKSSHLLFLILTFAAVTRLTQLDIPKTYYFDEVYHAYTAKSYARNDPRGYEWWNSADEEGAAFEWLHPPISKLIMAGSIKIFGENSFAWRFPSAIMGIVAIWAIYLLAKELFSSEKIALLAAFFGSLDGLLLVQSRIAMNDIYLVSFMIFSYLFYWRYKEAKDSILNTKYSILTSMFIGLSMATKWTGVFIIPVIGFIEGIDIAKTKKVFTKSRSILFSSLLIIPAIVYIFSYTQFFLQGHSLDQFIELHNQIFRYQFNLDATHPYQSKAWEWSLLLKNVWYHVDYSQAGKIGNIFARSNLAISWFGLAAVAWLFIKILFNKNYQKESYILLTTAYLFIWLPWIFSPRIMFYYHYAPAIPFLCIILARALFGGKKKLIIKKNIAFLVVGLSAAVFFIQLPHWIGIPVSKEYSDFLFWLPSWR